MMLPTHALAGMALALPLATVSPTYAAVGALAGFLGGTVPDLDMYAHHRKTLHYPVYATVLAVSVALVTMVVTTTVTVAAAFFLMAAALHAVTDVLGCGIELRPWEETSDRAVYDHYHDRWRAPRRLVSYDGSPGDLFLAALFSLPLLFVLDGFLQGLVIVAVAVATVYAVCRRRLVVVATRGAGHLPRWAIPYVPIQLHDELRQPRDVESGSSRVDNAVRSGDRKSWNQRGN